MVVVCEHEFGNASGHSMLASGIAVTATFDLFFATDGLEMTSKVLCRCLILVAAGAYACLMGFSRVVIGVHTWN